MPNHFSLQPRNGRGIAKARRVAEAMRPSNSGPPKKDLRYPKSIVIQGTFHMDRRLVFVEDGGVRIDNAGPFPPKEIEKLHRWLGRFLLITEQRNGG